MAPVSLRERLARAREEGDRAQLLLVGALSLAIALVAVALILNSAIYTHNLASRQDSPSEGVVTFARDVRAGAGETLDYANRQEGTDGYADVGNAYTEGVDTLGASVNGQAAVDVAATRVSDTGTRVRGVRVVHESGAFEPRSTGLLTSYDSWTVARGVRVRSFVMEVDPPGTGLGLLAEIGLDEAEDFLKDLAGVPQPFVVEFVDDTAKWRVAVFEDVDTGEPTVVVHEVGTSVSRSCSVAPTTERVTLDVTGGRFGGEPCAPLRFLDTLSGNYTVRYYNGGFASGSYELYADLPVDGTGSETGTFTDAVDEVNYGAFCAGDGVLSAGPTYYGPTSTDSPRVVPAVYSTELDLRYDSPDVTFAGTHRVAPGDPGSAPVEPRIVDVTVTDNSDDGDDDDAEFALTVDVTDPNGDLATVTAQLASIDSSETSDGSVSGTSDTAMLTVENEDGDGSTYTIVVTVEDSEGNSRTVRQTHDADGDGSGCAP